MTRTVDPSGLYHHDRVASSLRIHAHDQFPLVAAHRWASTVAVQLVSLRSMRASRSPASSSGATGGQDAQETLSSANRSRAVDPGMWMRVGVLRPISPYQGPFGLCGLNR